MSAENYNDLKMLFGKHEGTRIGELSHEYCTTLLSYKFNQPRLSPEFKDAIEKRIGWIENHPKWIERKKKEDEEYRKIFDDWDGKG